MIGPSQHRSPAGFIHNAHHFRRVGGDHHRSDLGGLRAAQNMHDHRLAGDIGEGLARQPGRGHAGGNEDEDISHREPVRACLYGLQDTRQTG